MQFWLRVRWHGNQVRIVRHVVNQPHAWNRLQLFQPRRHDRPGELHNPQPPAFRVPLPPLRGNQWRSLCHIQNHLADFHFVEMIDHLNPTLKHLTEGRYLRGCCHNQPIGTTVLNRGHPHGLHLGNRIPWFWINNHPVRPALRLDIDNRCGRARCAPDSPSRQRHAE